MVKDPVKRILTAKGYKFLYTCLDIIAEHKGTHRYAKEFKQIKEKFSLILHDLFIDKRMTKEEVINLIKSRKFLEQ